ncbi:MAG TPA: electron transport complex subunit RsxG [Gammaproteobacteria bacterium]|nr:electron transport complex subunit RsxG [Gammaproteobacteria bacterium]
MLAKHMLRTAIVLGLFAVVGTGVVALTFDKARVRIAENERIALLHKLSILIPPGQYNNDLLADSIVVNAKAELGSNKPVTVYRARRAGQPIAAVFTPVVAPDGYSGPIKLLIAVRYDGSLAGVRVIAHRETPGLGDPIEENRSDWILNFTGRSLSNPLPGQWKVKRDGGQFDQFTGATITPRAVVKAVYNCLHYFAEHKQRIFTDPPQTQEKPKA